MDQTKYDMDAETEVDTETESDEEHYDTETNNQASQSHSMLGLHAPPSSRFSQRLDNELEGLIRDDPIYPYLELPPHLRHPNRLPPKIVLFAELMAMHPRLPPRVKALEKLCRKAFQSWTLSQGWLNSRRFIDSDFRAPVEFVPDFSRIVHLRAERNEMAVWSTPGYAINLEIVARGLKRLLEDFEPDYYRNSSGSRAAVSLKSELLRKIDRYLRTYCV